MWQNPKLFQSTAQLLPPQTPPPLLPPATPIPDSSTLSLLKHQCRFSRRDLAVFTTTSSLLLLKPLRKAHADENAQQEENSSSINRSNSGCLDTSTTPTKKAFLDISIDGEPAGRIVIGLFGNSAPAGVAKFSDFISGAAGISYRRKEFVKIMPNYVQHGGLRSYGVDAELAAKTTTGGNFAAIERLRDEWERVNGDCGGTTKNLEGRIGIVVRDPLKPPPKLKLVARKGKLEVDEEEVGKEPNGTEFTIATKDSPELDAAVLVVGRVLEGMEVVHSIGQVKTVQENSSSPYFRVAKLIGDKRATVAERGFNRPYSKVVVSNCGLLD